MFTTLKEKNVLQDICGPWSAQDPSNDLLIGGLRFGLACQKAAKKQEWTVEKPTLDNARTLRGVHFIDPEDGEHKETVKNARKRLEVRQQPQTGIMAIGYHLDKKTAVIVVSNDVT